MTPPPHEVEDLNEDDREVCESMLKGQKLSTDSKSIIEELRGG